MTRRDVHMEFAKALDDECDRHDQAAAEANAERQVDAHEIGTALAPRTTTTRENHR